MLPEESPRERGMVQPKYEDRCMSCLENLIKILSKFYKKLIKNASKMLPEWSQVGSRRPLESSLGSGTLPRRVRTAKPRPPDSKTPAIWDPKIDPEAFQNRFGKLLQSKLAFETDLEQIFDRFSSRWKQIFDPNWKPLLTK